MYDLFFTMSGWKYRNDWNGIKQTDKQHIKKYAKAELFSLLCSAAVNLTCC